MKTKLIKLIIVIILFALVDICFAAWDNTKPADSDGIYTWPTSIRANWDALEAVFGVDLDLTSVVLEASDVNAVDLITSKSPMVDIRAFLGTGYVVDGSVDYTAEIQAAFDTADYNTVFISAGDWKITSTINVGPSTSVTGVGFNSRIVATGCDAFAIPISGSLGGTEWSKLQISGDSASAAYRAFEVLGNADAAVAAGVTFRKLYINKIGTGFFLRGLSFSRIVDCTINDVWKGIHIEGQCLRLVIEGNDILRDALGTGIVTGGAGNSTGIVIDKASDYNPGGVTTKGPESTMISNNGIFGFEYGIDSIYGLYTQIFSNDLMATVSGVLFTIKNANLTIRDNFMEIKGAAAMYGVQGRGGAVSASIGVVEHNFLIATDSPHANSTGIHMGTNQDNIITQYNSIVGFQLYDIHYTANKGGVIRDNACYSTDPPTHSILADGLTGGIIVKNNVCVKAITGAIPALDDTGTPSILYADTWLTGGTNAITDFDDGQAGDVITIIGQHVLTITDGAHIVLDGGANMAMTSGDTLMLIQLADTKWYQLSESNNN